MTGSFSHPLRRCLVPATWLPKGCISVEPGHPQTREAPEGAPKSSSPSPLQTAAGAEGKGRSVNRWLLLAETWTSLQLNHHASTSEIIARLVTAPASHPSSNRPHWAETLTPGWKEMFSMEGASRVTEPLQQDGNPGRAVAAPPFCS